MANGSPAADQGWRTGRRGRGRKRRFCLGRKRRSDSVWKLNPNGNVDRKISHLAKPGGIAVDDDGFIWVALGDVDKVVKLDPQNGHEVRRYTVGNNPFGVTVDGDGNVWVTNRGTDPKKDTVSEIDPARHRPTRFDVGGSPKGIAVTEDMVWVANTDDNTVSRIDPKTRDQKEFPVGTEPRGVVAAFDSIWVTLGGDNQVVRLDPETGDVDQRIDVGRAPTGSPPGRRASGWRTSRTRR